MEFGQKNEAGFILHRIEALARQLLKAVGQENVAGCANCSLH
jgi:hypothetical protein